VARSLPTLPHDTVPLAAARAVARDQPRATGATAPFLPGSVISGRYRAVREIGRGGFGVVWEALDTVMDDRRVAIKFLIDAIGGDPRALDELRREASIALELTHERIVRLHIFDTCETPQGRCGFLVFEHIAGPTLHDILSARGRVTPEEALLVTEQICEGLAYAHGRRVVHCDLKPRNILLQSPLEDLTATPLTEETCQIKLTDLGIAKSLRDAMARGATGPIIGSPTHISPEQIRGETPTPASDIYVLGCVIFQLLAGRPPFHSGDILAQHLTSPPPIVPRVTRGINAVLRRCLAKAPEARWPSALELAQALREAIESSAHEREEEAVTARLRHIPPPVRSTSYLVAPGKVAGPLRLAMRLIPGGKFVMGSHESQDGHQPDEAPCHRVEVKSFYLGKCPVTVGEYEKFLSLTNHTAPPFWEEQRRRQQRPVVFVSWFDAVAFCRWLCSLSKKLCRLPTEAEWECAARGALVGKLYPWGNGSPVDRAVFNPGGWRSGHDWAEIDRRLCDVGTMPPNRHDLHDMAGLVAEWCFDHYDPRGYAESPGANPTGPLQGSMRVVRGGSWLLPATALRCAARGSLPPASSQSDVGFRVVCDL
jgi:formylglycine-generating enzyme required for sulfatase activity